MANYRLYRLDGAGKISAAEWLDALDDAAALELARRLVALGAYELWDRHRLIARVEPGNPGGK